MPSTDVLHSTLVAQNAHKAYAWSYADQATREAATGFTPDDVGKLVLQEDDFSLWMLIDDDPVTYQELGGASDDAAIHDDVAEEIHAVDSKASPVDADELLIEDSEDSWNKKRVALSDLPGGGGGSVIYTRWDPDAPPSAPTAYDDEFNDSSFDSSLWTEFDPNNLLTISEGAQGLELSEVTRTGDNLTGVYMAAPAGDFSIICKPSISAGHWNYAGCGLLLANDIAANPTTSALMSFYSTINGSGYMLEFLHWTNHNTWAAAYKSLQDQVARPLYYRIRRVGTTLYADYSQDGIGWIQFTSTAQPWNVNYFGLTLNNINQGITIEGRVRFFRYSTDVSLGTPCVGRSLDVLA